MLHPGWSYRMSELLPHGIKFEAVDYCDTRYSNQLPSRSLWLSVRGDEWMCFFFSFKHESKISSIAEWTKCMCRKGGLPHSSGTGEAVGGSSWSSMFLSWQETFSPGTSKRHTFTFANEPETWKGKGMWEETEGGKCGSSVIMRQEFTVEIATMNNATVLPLERRRPRKMIPPHLMAQTAHYRCHICLHLHAHLIRSWRYELCAVKN